MRAALHHAFAVIALCSAGAAWGQASSGEPIRPLPETLSGDPARIALGRLLFYDARISRDKRQSCASCHDLKRGGADGKALSAGFGGKLGIFNTPTVYNSALNFRLSWIGREATLEGHLDRIIAGPAVFATTWPAVTAALAEDGALAAQFRQVYDDELRPEYLRDALVHFLR